MKFLISYITGWSGSIMKKYILALFCVLLLPAVSFAAEGEVGAHMLWRVIDFIIFAGILYYYLKKPIVSFFKNRQESIVKNKQEAEKSKDEAEKLFAEVERRLSKLNTEIESIIKTFSSMSEKEKENILKDAQAAAERVKAGIEEEEMMLLNKAKRHLLDAITSEALSSLSKKFSNLNLKDHQKIHKKYINFIGGSAS